MVVSMPELVFLYTSLPAPKTIVSPGLPVTVTLNAVVIRVLPQILGV